MNTIISDMPVSTSAAIQLTPLKIETLHVPIVGITPLIVHAWAEKSKRQMLEKMQSNTRAKKEARDPEADYNAARYVLDQPVGDFTDGFPAVGFKAAIIGGVRHFEGLTLVQAKACLFVEGLGPRQLVPIQGHPVMREDTVRVGMGTADLRYRPIYDPWEVMLTIRYVASMLTRESVLALVDAGGLGGVGEWRPSAPKSFTGSYGQFAVKAEGR